MECGDGLFGIGEVAVQLGPVELVEFAGKGEKGDGVLFELVDELARVEAGSFRLPGGEEAVGVGLVGAEGFADPAEDRRVGIGWGEAGLVAEPGAEPLPDAGEAFAFVDEAGDAVAGEGVIELEDLGLVVVGELLSLLEGGAEGGEPTCFAPGDPCAPAEHGGDGDDRRAEEGHAPWEVELHVGTLSKGDQVATAGPCGEGERVKWSFVIARLFGVEVRVHLTFFLLLVFFGFRGWSSSGTWQGMLGSVLFQLTIFGCVLLHEFGHVLMARRFGIRTRDVTLLPIGGLARMESTGETPRQELLIAVAGPLVNVVIALGAFVWWRLSADPSGQFDAQLLSAPAPLALMVANLFLVLFNLIPAFPMDGGRVLRALLSWKRDRVWATRVAAGIGKGVAFLMGTVGLFLFQPILMLIALFVWMGASQEAEAVATQSALAGVTVRQTMMTEFRVAEPFQSVGEVAEWLLAGYQQDFPVVAQGEVVGVLMRDDLIGALRERGTEVLVREAMRSSFTQASPGELIDDVLRRAQVAGTAALTIPVVEAGRLVGLVTPENVGEFLMVQMALRSGSRG